MKDSGNKKRYRPYNLKEILSDEDVYEAMKLIPGYLDISLADFRELYLYAFQHAEKRIRETIRVERVMTDRVISVNVDEPVHQVAAVMADNKINGVPVVNNDNVVAGIISREDFFSRLGEGKYNSCMALLADCLTKRGCAAISIQGKVASHVMTSPVVTVRPETLLVDVARIMSEKRINRFPVTDDNDFLVGFLSRSDLINFFPFR